MVVSGAYSKVSQHTHIYINIIYNKILYINEHMLFLNNYFSRNQW